jgi:epoxide hydrolase-like predicted phosphatase
VASDRRASVGRAAGERKGAGPDGATPQPRDGVHGPASLGARRGLLVDWGGVMTGNLLVSFSAFCEAEGLEPDALIGAFRGNRRARELLFGFEEGRIEEREFERELGSLLGVGASDGLIDRLFAGSVLEESMVEAVRAARSAGVRTGMISNSWGTSRYPRELLAELFDGTVISGEVGLRKPAPRIYQLGAEAIALDPAECVFVDDLPFNLPPAQELGMAVVHHTAADTTIAELERLLEVPVARQLDRRR